MKLLRKFKKDPSESAGGNIADEVSKEEKNETAEAPSRWTFGSFLKHHRALTALLAVFLVVDLLLGTAYGYFHSKYLLLQFNDGKLQTVSSLSEEDKKTQNEEDEKSDEEMKELTQDMEQTQSVEATGDVTSDDGVTNILLIGTDDRTKKFNDNARGDSCILCSINNKLGKITLTSFERGQGVPILDGEYEGQYDWLTHSFRYGGADLMMKEIRECYKIDVTKYIRVNIYTYMQVVNSVGGIDVDLTEAEADNINHPEGTYTAGYISGMHVQNEVQQDLTVGVNHLNGATAMCYARLRSIDSDWHRVERQRTVILSCVDQIKNLSAFKLNSLFDEVLPLVQTNMTEGDIADLVMQASTLLNSDFEQWTMPLSNTYGVMTGMGGRSMYAVDFDTNASVLKAVVYNGESAETMTDYYDNLTTKTYKRSELYSQYSSYGSGTSSGNTVTSGTTVDGTAQTTEGTDAGTSTDGTTAVDGSATGQTANYEIVSVESDPATGVVTTTMRDTVTGAIVVTAVNPGTGAQTITAQDPTTGATYSSHTEGTTTTDTGTGTDTGTVTDGAAESAASAPSAAAATTPAATTPTTDQAAAQATADTTPAQ